MSLAGEHGSLLGGTLADDGNREAGIFSTISVPTSISRLLEPASTGSGLPLLDGIIDDITPDEIGIDGSNASSAGSTVNGAGAASATPTGIPDSSIGAASSASPSTNAGLSRADPLTIFTTIPASSTSANPPGPPATSGLEIKMNNSNILSPSSTLFPLGITIVILGCLSVIALAALLIYKCHKRRRQRRLGDRILSFSPEMRDAPYPFDAKAYGDDIESRYPAMPRDAAHDNDAYHGSPPRLAHIGIASSFTGQFNRPPQPSNEVMQVGYYAETRRAGPLHGRPDTFTCAMFPVGSCPIEHEQALSDSNSTARQGAGSPVPSFHTARLDDHQPTIISHRDHNRSPSGKLLTPPQPKYKSKHIPTPLVISPSINEGTNSIRGFTPRKSIISAGSAYTGI